MVHKIHLAYLVKLQSPEPHFQKFWCIINIQKSESDPSTFWIKTMQWPSIAYGKTYKLYSVA